MLYGFEIWHLKRYAVSELEKVQNITVLVMQRFLSGTSGSASRRILDLLSIEAETDKRKLYFLGRVILMSYGIPCRRMKDVLRLLCGSFKIKGNQKRIEIS